MDIEAVNMVCKKLDSYIDIIDNNEDYDFISDLDDPNLTLMGLMIARGYLRKDIEISSSTVPILFGAESTLTPIIRSFSGDDNV